MATYEATQFRLVELQILQSEKKRSRNQNRITSNV